MSIAILEQEIIHQLFDEATAGWGRRSENMYRDLFVGRWADLQCTGVPSSGAKLDPELWVPAPRDWRGPTVRFDLPNELDSRYYRLAAQTKEWL